MKKLKIDKKIIFERMKIIEIHVGRLEEIRELSKAKFAFPDNFAIAAYNLRSALEATFDICAHILSRIPGAQIDEYKKMALEMGRQKVIPNDFAEENLYEMAGYRNRLTHFYFEVSAKEMHKIIQNNLDDFRVFLKHIKKFVE
ncbi:DUF86 domain-containing protein [Patescibacteria group bacterium]|nr:DUF86 domain-containing protein [Patescibacteria group bacterium]